MAAFLNTYRPLIWNRAGRTASAEHGLPPYVDASCRREPDFEAEFPSISALCRVDKFAPRLHVGDIVAYLTRKGSYGGFNGSHWRLTAVLQVQMRFESHVEAASWYFDRGLTLPRNCMIAGNPPLPLDRTDAFIESLRVWDREYQKRSEKCGVFLACAPLFRELWSPPVITPAMMLRTFGRIPGTQNPPAISKEELNALLKTSGLAISQA